MIELVAAVAREHLAAGRPLVTRVRGHSMWPWLRDGDAVTIVALDRPPQIGDVVLVETRSLLVLHRVVARAGATFVIKGDAEPTRDGRVGVHQILGRLDRGSSRLIAALSDWSGPWGARGNRLMRGLWNRVVPR